VLGFAIEVTMADCDNGKTGRWTGPVMTIIVAGFVLVGISSWIAAVDDARGRTSLSFLTPMVTAAADVGGAIIQHPKVRITRAGGTVAAALVTFALLLWTRRQAGKDDRFGAILAVAVAVVLVAQVALLHERFALGAALYALSVVALFVGSVGMRKVFECDDGGETPAVSYGEAAALLGFVAVAVILRYFALNRVVNHFEGELSPYMLGATSAHGMFLANIGFGGPWAPLGLLYYLPILVMQPIAGSTVLAVRLGSALVAVGTIFAVYLLVRHAFGRSAALISAALLAVDSLQIGWGRSDIHPHGATAWPGVLLCWATIRALEQRTIRWFVVVMMLMGLTWHQYPSGQFAVVVPVVGFFAVSVTERGFLRRHLGGGLLIAGGGILWALGYPMSTLAATGRFDGLGVYADLLGPRIYGNTVDGVSVRLIEYAAKIAGNTWDLVLGLFVRVPHLFHQTFIPEVNGLTFRTLPWVVAACAVVGVVMCLIDLRRPRSVVLLTFAASAALPSVLSETAYPKRASVMYLALVVIAALPLARIAEIAACRFGRRWVWASGWSVCGRFPALVVHCLVVLVLRGAVSVRAPRLRW
jgi:hypothetical protein